jgi:hypothetical protein
LAVYANSKAAYGNRRTMCLTVDGRVHVDTVGAAPVPRFDGEFSQRCDEVQEGALPCNVVLSLPSSFIQSRGCFWGRPKGCCYWLFITKTSVPVSEEYRHFKSFFLKHLQRYRSVVLDWAIEVRHLNFFDNSKPVFESISSCQLASNRVTDSLQYPLCGLDTMVLSLFKNRNTA